MSFVIQCNKFRKRTSAMYKNRYAHRCLSFSIHLIENRPNIFKRFDVRLLLIYTYNLNFRNGPKDFHTKCMQGFWGDGFS